MNHHQQKIIQKHKNEIKIYIFLQNNIYMKLNINNIGMFILIIFLIYFVYNIFNVQRKFLLSLNKVEGFSDITKRNLVDEIKSLDLNIKTYEKNFKIVKDDDNNDDNFESDQKLFKNILESLEIYNNYYILDCANNIENLEKWFENKEPPGVILKTNVFQHVLTADSESTQQIV